MKVWLLIMTIIGSGKEIYTIELVSEHECVVVGQSWVNNRSNTKHLKEFNCIEITKVE